MEELDRDGKMGGSEGTPIESCFIHLVCFCQSMPHWNLTLAAFINRSAAAMLAERRLEDLIKPTPANVTNGKVSAAEDWRSSSERAGIECQQHAALAPRRVGVEADQEPTQWARNSCSTPDACGGQLKELRCRRHVENVASGNVPRRSIGSW